MLITNNKPHPKVLVANQVTKIFGILERQMPIMSAVGACRALQKMLQDFFDQFQVASFMSAKFDLGTSHNCRIL